MRNFRIFIRESLFPRSKAEGGDGLAPLAIVGEADAYLSFDGISRHNSVGSWTLSMPAGHPQSRMIQPGRGIVVYQDGDPETLFSGPIRQIEKVWDSENAGAGSVVATGVDDNYLLAERLAWPNPAQDIHMSSRAQWWQTSPDWRNVAELLRQLFLANTQGIFERRIDRLFIPSADVTAAFLDDDTTRSARLSYDQPDQLVSMLSAVYGFRIRFLWHPDPASVASNGDPDASGPGILLKLDPISDLTNDVRFGAEFGNLRGYKYSVKAPEATRLVVGAQNRQWRELVRVPTYDQDGVESGFTEQWVEHNEPERWFGYYTNHEYDPEWWGDPEMTPADQQHTLDWATAGYSATETDWGVTAERYIDKRDIPWQWVQQTGQPAGWTQDPPVWSAQFRAIQDQVDAFNLDSGPVASISIDPIETNLAMYGRDYNLGDLIRVIIDGEVRDEIVREARLSSDQTDGPRVTTTIGTYGSSETPWLYASIKALWSSVQDVRSREDTRHTLEEVPLTEFVLQKVEA